VVGGRRDRQGRRGEGEDDQVEDLPYNILDHAWFVAFAPVDDPQIVVAAMWSTAGTEGPAAAPIVKSVMQEFFRTRAVGRAKGGA